jgi:hypothetical protein
MTLLQVFGLLNIFVGLFLVASFLLFGGGFIVWLARLGTIHREEGVKFMEWGVVVLFVLVVLLGLVRLIERYTTVVAYVVGIIVLVIIALFVLNALQQRAEQKKEE